MTDPWTTERMADLDREAQRKKRRGQLRLLWTLLVAVLAVQAAVAYYSYQQHVRAAAVTTPRLEVGDGLVRSGEENDAALALAAAVDAREAAASADAAIAAVRADARRTSSRKRTRRSAARRPRRERPRAPKEPDKSDTPGPPVHDLKLPVKVVGNAERGARIFRMGCGLCHGRTTRRLSPKRYGAKGWRRFFASGKHGRHDLYRSNFTRVELSDVKAYLISKAE